jgi:uncharacterized protein (TIGR03085 family)
MGEITLAVAERLELSDLLAQVGPDAPTLCGGWTTRDLAAHLAIRDGRPDAAAGMLLAPLARYTARVQRDAARRAWPELVEQVRRGPPWWSPMRLPAGEKINAVEFFVHHEDVRRARAGWTRRPADPQRSAQLWEMLGRLGRLCYRSSPVGVVLRGTDGEQRVARHRARSVTVVGSPEELMLHAYGRDRAVVEFEGDQVDVAALQASPRGF